MVTVSKKHQTSLALIAIVLATTMIAGTFASSSDKMAYAIHIKKAKVSQSVSEACSQDQNSPVATAGGISPPILSGINLGACINVNLGGNVGNADSLNQ